MSTILERMAALREKAQAEQLGMQSELATTPTPLFVSLEIVAKSYQESMLNYMEGARILEEWLTTPDTQLVHSFVDANDIPSIPDFLSGYYCNELAKIPARYNGAVVAPYNLASYAHYHKELVHFFLIKAGYRYEP